MSDLRFALVGTGFWSRFQLAAWTEVQGARCVAIYGRSLGKATALAREFGVPLAFDDLATMLDQVSLDFVDVVTSPSSHPAIVYEAAKHRLPVICQKPLALTLSDAEAMAGWCRDAGITLFVHENFRWQRPIRRLKSILDSRALGRPFRARLTFATSFPVFERQPSLRDEERFILADVGVHLLDVARFLFGDARSVYCRTHRINSSIQGEDVATVMADVGGVTVTCEMSFASVLENECFPQTYALVECDGGSVELTRDFWVRVTDSSGTSTERVPPQTYAWADIAFEPVHASIVDCNAHLLRALQDHGEAETTVADNLETLRMVFGAYESATTGRSVTLTNGSREKT